MYELYVLLCSIYWCWYYVFFLWLCFVAVCWALRVNTDTHIHPHNTNKKNASTLMFIRLSVCVIMCPRKQWKHNNVKCMSETCLHGNLALNHQLATSQLFCFLRKMWVVCLLCERARKIKLMQKFLPWIHPVSCFFLPVSFINPVLSLWFQVRAAPV